MTNSLRALNVAVCALALQCAAATSWPWAAPQSSEFPQGFNMINVKNASLPNGGAKGDGMADDWLALQSAINLTSSRGFAPVYLPAGTYMISKPLMWPNYKGGIESRSGMIGQSVVSTTIRIIDNSPAFASDAAMLHIGGGVAQNFYNFVQNVAFDTGKGNCGASGLRFDANNMGDIRNISISSSDPTGCGGVGLDFAYNDQIGPMLSKFIYVQGFNTGVASAFNVDSQTFEHIWLSGQLKAGISNTGQVVTYRQVTIEATTASVLPIVQTSNEGNDAFLTLVDSTIINTLGAQLPVAINSSFGMAFIRNVAMLPSATSFVYGLVHAPYVPGPPPPPPPVYGCTNTTVLSDVAGNSHEVSQSGAPNATQCCYLCERYTAANPSNPCLLWSWVSAAGSPANMCYLHNGTSMYPRANTYSGTVAPPGLSAAWSPTCGSGVNDTKCLPGGYIDEWTSHAVVSLWNAEAPGKSLNLTVMETPEPQPAAVATWGQALAPWPNGTLKCSTHESHDCYDPITGLNRTCYLPDCGPVLQETIDSGVRSVWLTPRTLYPGWTMDGNVSIPPSLTYLYGGGTQYSGDGFFLIDQGDENDPPLVIERLIGGDNNGGKIIHSSRRTVILKDTAGWSYAADCSHSRVGDLFIEDIVESPLAFCAGQHVWARQLNLENQQTDFNATGGAQVWVLGYKTERGAGGLARVDGPGSALEVLGVFSYSTSSDPKVQPLFNVSAGARYSGTFREYNANCNPFQVLVQEEGTGPNQGTVRQLLHNFSVPGVIPGHGNPGACPAGFTGDPRSSGYALYVSGSA